LAIAQDSYTLRLVFV